MAGFDKSLFEEMEARQQQASASSSSRRHQQQVHTSSNHDHSNGHTSPPISQSLGSVTLADLPPFHDASPCVCTYELTVLDCLKGMAKARLHGFYDHESFDVDEYEHFEQVENGDLNWIVKGKILAFAGPSYERHVSPEGYCTLSPSDYLPYFQRKNVGLVIRLNKKCYNEQDFIEGGIDHCDAFFLDGSCPPTKILQKVITAMEALPADKAIAIHCKAGLGRTGTCIGAYLMKHYRFTASEAIGWMRICRPGMVIGPQQHFLHQIEQSMWQEGDLAGVVKRPLGTAASYDNEDEDEVAGRSSGMDGVNKDEAVRGREGQAAALLAARGRRPAQVETTLASSTPRTNRESASSPEMTVKESPVPVTPETPSAVSQLWCGGGL
ncbi:hypothetical protein MPSEU_000583800 [Mayamaea pseudoterrestris]|nr:hypothetical protein MPSEU_000583800 [Mayamaea pseudoterrestris]